MNVPAVKTRTIEERVLTALDDIRQYVNMDGGDFEFVGITDDVVTIKLQGACVGCGMSNLTLKMGIEQRLREEVPQIRSVEAVE